VIKESSTREVVIAVENAMKGEYSFDQSMLKQMVSQLISSSVSDRPVRIEKLDILSSREKEVFFSSFQHYRFLTLPRLFLSPRKP